MRVAKHIEIEWLDQRFAPATCPNCGTTGTVQQYLNIDYHPPQQKYRFILQICPHCTARFVDNTHMMDYAGDHLIEIGWNIYQSQAGAGIWPISAPLTRIDKPAGARVLEIGGAYGFGLDFCILARGWRGEGYDPSPLAAFGAREMGLNIGQDYFTEKNLSAGPWDVAISTEVIEHLEHPPEFLALMRRALGTNGILLLTTPNAEWITPELGADDLVSLLSPDAHLVLQTQMSLRAALANAGFKHVVVKRESMTLIAYASATPFVLNEDMAAGRAMYRRYLAARGRLSTPASDLRFGFAGRALFEAANDGDTVAAEEAWTALLPGAKERFGLDLDTIDFLPQEATGASLMKLAKLVPLGLGMILYARAMHLLGKGQSRQAILPMLRVARDAIIALQKALSRRSLNDGLSTSIGKAIEREILLSQAEAGDAQCLPRLIALDDKLLGWRGFVALINADALNSARALREALLPEAPSAVMPDCAPALLQDALAACLILELRSGSDAPRMLQCLEDARRGLMEAARIESLTASMFLTFMNRDSVAAARLLLPCIEPFLAKLQPPFDDATCILQFHAGTMFLAKIEDSPKALDAFSRLRAGLVERSTSGAEPDPLFWPALRGEVVALHKLGRAGDATELLQKFTAVYLGAPSDLLKQLKNQKA